MCEIDDLAVSSRQMTSNYLERIILCHPTHMKSIVDLVVISVAILKIGSGCSLGKRV